MSSPRRPTRRQARCSELELLVWGDVLVGMLANARLQPAPPLPDVQDGVAAGMWSAGRGGRRALGLALDRRPDGGRCNASAAVFLRHVGAKEADRDVVERDRFARVGSEGRGKMRTDRGAALDRLAVLVDDLRVLGKQRPDRPGIARVIGASERHGRLPDRLLISRPTRQARGDRIRCDLRGRHAADAGQDQSQHGPRSTAGFHCDYLSRCPSTAATTLVCPRGHAQCSLSLPWLKTHCRCLPPCKPDAGSGGPRPKTRVHGPGQVPVGFSIQIR